MAALHRKLIRQLARLRMQGIAIALVVAAAVALYVGTATTARALRLSEESFYTNQRFADVWSPLSRAPTAIADQIAALPGVAVVQARLVAQGVLDLPTVAEPATGLFLSIRADRPEVLDDVYVRRGRRVGRSSDTEALVSEAFADRNGLRPGDVVGAVIGGSHVALRIVGVALSPEFIMQIPAGGLVPDDRRFGVFWVEHERLAALLDLRDGTNDIAVRLAGGASEAAVIQAIDRLADPYGGRGAYGRTSQPSHVMLESHIRPVVALAIVVPSIFLGVAIFLVNVVLSRLVALERSQIGMLKAFGYSNAALVRHYLALVVCIAAVGIVGGLPVGIWLGHLMSTWFGTFFRFPHLVLRPEVSVIGAGVLAVLASIVVGTIVTLSDVIRLPPIVAMSPPAPVYRTTLVDRWRPLLRICAPSMRMIVRSVFRRPIRAVLTSAAMALAVAIVIFGGFTADALARVIDVRFQHQERQDLSVVLTHPASLEQWPSVRELPGLRLAEPFRAVPVRLHTPGRAQDAVLMGLPAGGRLRQIVDLQYRSISVSPEGVVLGAWLARSAGIRVGDLLTVEIREGDRRFVAVRVSELVDEPLGTNLYVDLRALGRSLGEPEAFSGVTALVDPVKATDLYATLKRAPRVLGVDFRKYEIANFRAMGDDTVAFIRRIEIVFAMIIACGVVYNAARIALAERAYELATLRVLGFTRREVSTLLLGEIALLGIPAVPIGCVVGYALSAWLSGALSTQLFRFPIVVNPRTYLFGVAVFVAAAAGSALVVRRRLDRLDLIEVLKARE